MSTVKKITKRKKISFVIIKPENIREIAAVFKREFDKGKGSDIRKRLNFILKGEDDTQYESDNPEIFLDGGILNNRKIVAIDMNYTNFEEDKSIFLSLNHSLIRGGYGNEISISGRDEIWVNGIFKSFEEAIGNFEKQKVSLYKLKWPLILVVGIGFGWLDMLFTDWFVKVLTNKDSYTVFRDPIQYIFGFVVGICVGYLVYLKAHVFFPVVELAIGPVHVRYESILRRRVWLLFVLCLIPLMISIIVEIMKNLFT